MTEDSIIFTPEKSKKIALARLDLLNQWKEFRRKSDNKLQADYDFVNLHNTSNSHLFEILGKISRGTLHRYQYLLYRNIFASWAIYKRKSYYFLNL